MGGVPCKVVIDDANALGMIAQLQETLHGIDRVIVELDEYLTPKEREQALKLSYETCEFAEEIGRFSDKLKKWYTEVAERHAGTGGYDKRAGNESPPGGAFPTTKAT